MSREVTEESFLKDVEKHKVTVLMDNGVYRHIRCSSGSFNMQFDIVTYPDYLVYSGDMGSFVFTRLEDMFQFFRDRKQDGKLHINLDYWGEKLEAVDRNGRQSGYRVYSAERMKERIEDQIKGWIEEYPDDELTLREDIEDEVYIYLDDGEDAIRRALNDFGATINGHKYEFQDQWEWECDEYTLRFVWCCYAISWTIQKYDALKDYAKESFTEVLSD